MVLPKRLISRFFCKYIVDAETGCWEWTASKYKNGYGCMRVNKKLTGAHRISMVIYKGFNLDERLVLHHCDNKSCVNPKHLFLGNKSDNALDLSSKGLHPSQLKTECVNGHRYTESNTYRFGKDKKYRRCKQCMKEYRNGK